MYDHILLPTDGSPGMGSTIEQGIHQATQNDATIHTLYVIDVRSNIMLPEETSNQVAQLLEAEGRNALKHVEQRVEGSDIEVKGDLRVGVPHEAILAYAGKNDIDLIVMGTHGRTGDKKRIVGSVAEEVVRNADVPVLTVRMSEAERREVDAEITDEQQRYIS